MRPEALVGRCLAYLAERCEVRGGDSGLVAVSGGGDSMVLLEVLHRCADSLGLSLEVVTVDHALRASSSEEARRVASACESRGLACHVVAVDVRRRARRDRLCLEEAARQERRTALESARIANGAAWVALGHSRTDQAETLIQRLHRGAGIDGVACMEPRAGPIVRPLLWASRGEIRRAGRALGLSWTEDPSNEDRRFERVVVRQDLIPWLDEQSLAALAEDAGAIRRVLREGEDAWARLRCRPVGPALLVTRSPGPATLGTACQARAMRRVWERLPGAPRPPSRARLADLLAVVRGEAREAHLPGVVATRVSGAARGGVLLATRPAPPPPRGATLRLDGPGTYRSDDLRLTAVVGGEAPCSPMWCRVEGAPPLTVRLPRPGDRISGSRSKLARRLARQAVPRTLRGWVPLVGRGPLVCWAATDRDRGQGGLVVSLRLDVDHPLRAFQALVRDPLGPL